MDQNEMQGTALLVKGAEAARRFGISYSQFCRYVTQIIAKHGLKRIKVGKTFRYLTASIEQVVHKCADNGESLFDPQEPKGLK